MFNKQMITYRLIRDYYSLTKPRVLILLLITALGGMVMASNGIPDMTIMLSVLLAGALAGGGAQAMNQSLDKKIDSAMLRTRGRPVASGRISGLSAIVFGGVLNLLAFSILVFLVNPLSALVTVSGTAFYVLIYTIMLKKTTSQNIVIGGAAGAVPPVVGWVAVTGHFDLQAAYLFAIIFFWTPPHFWALSLLIKDDYERAGVPMLPVVTSVGQTKWHILFYTVVLVSVTILFVTTNAVGLVYLTMVLILGGMFLLFVFRLFHKPGIQGAKPLYLYSIVYLGLVFVAVAVDSVAKFG